MLQKNSVKQKIVIITGPTAIGKSDFAVECALKFNGEIISADSMQIFKKLNIGTGKITCSEMKGIKHHLLDFLDPSERYSVGQYVQDCTKAIEEILSRNKLPIIVGGTALYINALINGMNFSDAKQSETVRNKWKEIASQNGIEFVYNHICKIDSASAEKINPNDLKRIIRAIEIFEVTGKKKSESATSCECPYDYLLLIINDERTNIYSRINARVDKMVKLGLKDEVLALQNYENFQSMQAIGYKQYLDFFNGKYTTAEETIDEIKKLSRNYAKRQLTFLRGMNATNKNWITPFCENGYAIINNFLTE